MLALALLLAAADPAGAISVVEDGVGTTVLVRSLEAGEGVSAGAVELVDGRLRAVLDEREDIRTFHPEDVQRTLDLAADQASVGAECDTEACLAELADAMGAELVLYGRVGKIGALHVLQLDLFDSKAGRSVSRVQRESEQIENLLFLVEGAARELLAAPQAPDEPPPAAGMSALGWTGVSLAALGGAALLGGGATLGWGEWALAKDSGVDPVGRQTALDLAVPAAVVTSAGAVVLLGGAILAWSAP